MSEYEEIVCADGTQAEAEAQRRQELEADPAYEWIYLHNKSGNWVARRTERMPAGASDPPKETWVDAVLEVVNPLNWLN